MNGGDADKQLMSSLAPARFDDPSTRVLMAATLLVLNLCDLALTWGILSNGGLEANPVVRSVIGDPGASLGIKVAVAGSVALAAMLLRDRSSVLTDVALPATVGVYTVIVFWNCWIIALT